MTLEPHRIGGDGFELGDPHLISAIARRVDGPILVIGGGPSVPSSLEQLVAGGFKPACVISANGHGFKQTTFAVDVVVCCDPVNQETRQNNETVFRIHGKPIVTPCHFGDFRLPDWHLACNSGLTAIAVAAMLLRELSWPIVPIGIDCYRQLDKTAGTYFHNPTAKSNSLRKKPENFDKQIAALMRALGAYRGVRPLSGPLLEHYPRWPDVPAHPPGTRLGVMLEYVAQRDRVVILTGPSKRVTINLGQVEHNRRIAVSEDEAFRICNSYQARVVAPESHPLYGFRKGLSKPSGLAPPPDDNGWLPHILPRR